MSTLTAPEPDKEEPADEEEAPTAPKLGEYQEEEIDRLFDEWS
jgi:hypothetical protein